MHNPIIEQSIISLFEDNELNISRLYRIYSEKFPEHEDFWLKLAGEEIMHAEDIRKTYQGEKEDLFSENKFSRGAISYVIEFVERQIENAKKKEMTHFEALNVALRVEQSFLEKKCFELFMPTNLKVKNLMNRLNTETDKHIKYLQKEFKKEKNRKN